MSDNFGCNSCDVISGVYCDAKNCKHHTENDRCTANSIKVENSSATSKSETCCGTFVPLM